MLSNIFATLSLQATCYTTPHGAVNALQANSSIYAGSESGGYRVTGIQFDPVLEQRWVMIGNCSHPEWPTIALKTTGAIPLRAPLKRRNPSIDSVRQTPVVRAGDSIRLWKQEDILRIEVAGVSEGNAGLGQTVLVRLLRSNTGDQLVPQQFSGIVRGPANVEILP